MLMKDPAQRISATDILEHSWVTVTQRPSTNPHLHTLVGIGTACGPPLLVLRP